MGISAAVAAVASIAGSVYSAKQQRDAAKDASNAQKRAEMEARKIAAERKPMEETATLDLNTEGLASANDSLGLLIKTDATKRKNVGLGTSGTAGLGTSVTSQLGFGG